MAKKIFPLHVGRWPFHGFPEHQYEGVVAQYREMVETRSMHLEVYANGSWAIDRSDDANPGSLGAPRR